MALKPHTVTLTCDGSGDCTAYTPHVTGAIVQLDIVLGTLSTPDITVTTEDRGAAVYTEAGVAGSKTVSPRQPIHTYAGAAVTYDGTRVVYGDYFRVGRDRVKIVVAGGGNGTSGTMYVWID